MISFKFLDKIKLVIDLIKGEDNMDTFVIIFCTLVVNGKRDFTTGVPANLKPQVKLMLEELGMGYLAVEAE